MILFHDILEKFIAPIALYGDIQQPFTVTLYLIGSDEIPCIPYDYCSDYGGVDWHSNPFWFELFNLKEWNENGVLESFWSGSVVIPDTLNIYINDYGKHLECVLFWEEPEWDVIDSNLEALKYEEPDLYANVVAFLKTEGIEYGF